MKNPIKVINVNNIFTKINNTLILNDVSFNVFSGCFHGFIGPNGAGKSTAIKSILGAIPLIKGSINIYDFGFNVSKGQKPPVIGYVPESLKFNKTYTVKQFITASSLYLNLSKDKLNKLLNSYKDLLDIKSFYNRKFNSLSSGQSKLVMFFNALLTNPKIFILDEPMENLDPTKRIKLYNYLEKLVYKEDKTVFISSHGLEELQAHCDSLTFINEGKIIFSGKLEEAEKKLNKKNILIKFNSNIDLKIFKNDFKDIEIMKKKNNEFLLTYAKSINNSDVIKALVAKKYKIQEFINQDLNLTNLYNNFIKKK